MTRQNRQRLLTFVAAGLSALVAEHLLKPTLKRRLKV